MEMQIQESVSNSDCPEDFCPRDFFRLRLDN